MKVQSIFLASMTAIVGQSYIIDPNLPDGAYYVEQLTEASARMGENSPLYGEPVTLGGGTAARSVSDVAKRQLPISGTSCTNAIENRWDMTAAINNLKTQCANGEIPEWKDGVSGILLARAGSSLAYACSWGGSNPCSGAEVDDVNIRIANDCGGEVYGGEACMGEWKKCIGHTTFTSELCQNKI